MGASAFGTQVTTIGDVDLPSTFYFEVNDDAFLLLSTAPGTALSVSVAELFTVTPSSDYSVTGQQGNIPASPHAYTLSNLGTSSLTYSVTVSYKAGASSWLSVSPASGTLPGNSAAVVTVSTSSEANSLSPGTYTATITLSSDGTSITRNATLVVTAVGACVDISGSWNGTESGSANFTITAPVESDAFTDPVGGSGSLTITQTGCSIQYEPFGIAGLTGTNLTSSQLASLVRSGTVTGHNVSVSGVLALVDTVAAVQSGLTITNVSSNLITASGQVVDDVITLNETGDFNASGTYSMNGQSGAFTLTISTTSVAMLNRPSSVQPSARSSLRLHVVPDGNSPRTGTEGIRAMIRAALKKALVLGDR
jgi:hypothetical protein